MIQEFVKRFDSKRDWVRQQFRDKHPDEYIDIVRVVITSLNDELDYFSPDPERITEIDHGEYQGTKLFIIASRDYQPRTYWASTVDYGSCSVCDTLQGIRDYVDEKPTEEQVSQYFTLALHIVQGLKELDLNEVA